MPGQAKRLLESLVKHKSKGSAAIAHMIRAKLALKGLDLSKYHDNTEDDPALLERIRSIAREYGVEL